MRRMRVWSVIVVAIAAVFAGRARALSVEPFAKDAEFVSVKVSPDGDRLGVTMRVDGRVLLNVIQVAGMKTIGTFGVDGGRDVEDFYWANNDRLLFGLSYRLGKDEAPVSTGDLMAVNVDGTKVATLFGREVGNLLIVDYNRRDWEIVDLLGDDEENVLVSKYEFRAPDQPFLYKVNINTGRRVKLLQARNRFGEFVTDHDGKVRFQVGTEPDGTSVLLYRASEKERWKEIGRFAPNGGGSINPIGFATDNRRIYFADNRDAATAGLFVVDPDQPQPQLLFRHPNYDFDGLLPSRSKGVPIGVHWEAERTEWQYFEPHHPDVALFESIRQAFKGKDVSIVNFSNDRTKAVFYAQSDVEPGSFYLIDLERKNALARFPTHPWIDSAQMAPMKPIALKSRDGLDLRGYITLPTSASAGNAKKMVVMPHGGPIGVRDYWAFDPEVQWLAKNGYAVLQVNFRGSGGYGKTFQSAGYGEWGEKMQNDLTDATHWAIEQGFADASAICIYGASYGAYAALMGVVKEKDLYRCAVGYVGLYDLEMWKRDSLAASYDEGRAYQDAVLGKDDEQLRKRSPAWRAAEIDVPVLLVHGGEDRRTPLAQFDRMKTALEKAQKQVQTLLKKNEGHGFASEKNRAEFMTRLVEFLDASIAAPVVAASANE